MPNLYASVFRWAPDHPSESVLAFLEVKTVLGPSTSSGSDRRGRHLAGSAAQHSTAVSDHYRDVLVTAYLGDDFTLFCFLFCITRWEHSFSKGNMDITSHICAESSSKQLVESRVCWGGGLSLPGRTGTGERCNLLCLSGGCNLGLTPR